MITRERSRWLNRPRDVGANLVCMIQFELCRSLATNNLTSIEQDCTQMWKDITILSSNNGGVKMIGLIIFMEHSYCPVPTGKTGHKIIFALIVCSHQTTYAIDEQQLLVFVQLITKADIILSNDTKVQILNLANRREDKKAEHSGQGVLNLYTSQTYDYDNIFPLLNWKALNAMMNTITHNLTATRSWHFYDDVIIALATDLTLITQTTGWTILANRLLPIGQITVGFFNETTVKLSDDIGPLNETDTARILAIWVDLATGLLVLD
ncbi:unnamed protein product [Adineta ricciae]|uniref:Uncharacterized protein n=1 Tax=Adineta ricciae TaxID=249248 RepID=A0A816CAU1_ADIRI|nr:unnamed protein product [Adineta ricciae]